MVRPHESDQQGPPATAVILVADDDADFIAVVRLAFEKLGSPLALFSVRDGEEAIMYLEGERPFASRARFPFPDLLLLDLKMPCVDGFQVLHWVRAQPELANFPVIVLSNSSFDLDIARAYQAGANSFLTKTGDFNELKEQLRTVTEYWVQPDHLRPLSLDASIPQKRAA